MTDKTPMVRDCLCYDPQNCTAVVPGYRCRKGELAALHTALPGEPIKAVGLPARNEYDQLQAQKERADRLQAERDAAMPSILFDGPTVYTNLTDRELSRTGPENVSDVLNAIVRALRKERSAIDAAKEKP